MQRAGTLDTGVYREGKSLLHTFDPRLKILLLLTLITCLFSASSPLRLLAIGALWVITAGFRDAFSSGMRVINLMKWLFIFTLLLHLFFTPGRTLFGTVWLSYDGLLRGLTVDAQVLLAVLFSLLLSWTTRPSDLAWGLARLLAPLRRFRVPVQETAGLLLLVLHFFPLIHEEVATLSNNQRSLLKKEGWLPRIRRRIALIEPLLVRLVDRADQLARKIAEGTDPLEIDSARADGRFRSGDLLLFVAGLAVLILLWML